MPLLIQCLNSFAQLQLCNSMDICIILIVNASVLCIDSSIKHCNSDNIRESYKKAMFHAFSAKVSSGCFTKVSS